MKEAEILLGIVGIVVVEVLIVTLSSHPFEASMIFVGALSWLIH